MASTISAGTTSGSAIAVAGDTSGVLALQTNGTTTAVTIDTSQNVKFKSSISVGDATPTTSGAGITFPATQSASSDANTLDDYEEGTWTPSLGGNTTYNTQAGNYVKIGKMVFVEGHLYINAIGTGSTSLVSGLPFTSAAQPTGVRATLSVNYFNAVANNIIYPALYLNASATTAQFQAIAAAGTTMSTIGIFANSTDIYFSGCYYVAN